MTKKCVTCGKVKHPFEFTKAGTNRDGFKGSCKVCVAAREKARRYGVRVASGTQGAS